MVMYDNEFETKENKIQTKKKIEPQHINRQTDKQKLFIFLFTQECRGQCEQAVTEDDNKLRERYKEKSAELRKLQNKVFVCIFFFFFFF